MTNGPKRVWDNKKRQVRQGKKQVWDVNGELKLNGGNKREDADSSYFQVYDNAWRQPEEPLKIYDNSWKELTPPTPPVELEFGSTYIITHYISEGTKRIRIGLTDSAGSISMDLYGSIENGSISSAQVGFNATDLGLVLSDLDWSWLTDDLSYVYNLFWNLGALSYDLTDNSVFEIDGTIISTGLIDSLNNTITGQMQPLIDFCGYKYHATSYVDLQLDTYLNDNGGYWCSIDNDAVLHLFDLNKDSDDPNQKMYIGLDRDNNSIFCKGVFDLSYNYYQDEDLNWVNQFQVALDADRVYEDDGTTYYVSDIWDWMGGTQGGLGISTQMNLTIYNQYLYSFCHSAEETVNIWLVNNFVNEFPILMRPGLNSDSTYYNSGSGGIDAGYLADGNVCMSFIRDGTNVSMNGVNGNTPQYKTIYSIFIQLSNDNLKILLNTNDLALSDGTGSLTADCYNALDAFMNLGVNVGEGYMIDGIDYSQARLVFDSFIQDCISNQTPIVTWNQNS